MKYKRWKQAMAAVLSLVLVVGAILPSYAYTGNATVKAANLNVRSGAGTSYSAIGKITNGTTVKIVGETTGTDGAKWYQIQYTSSGATKTGYVSAAYIKIPVSYSSDQNFETYLSQQGFPESYKSELRALHAQHPNWEFRALHTNLDWNTVIENEAVIPRNLVSNSSISSWKSVESGAYNWDTSKWTGFDGSNWVAASKEIISYYMDPRNFLDETYVFQFLSQEYNAATQTREGLASMVKNSFLSGAVKGSSGSSSSTSSSGSSSQSSSGPISSGTRNGEEDSAHGPGVQGNAAKSSSPDTNTSSGDSVSLQGPTASITPKNRFFVGDTVSLEPPGATTTNTPTTNSPMTNGPVSGNTSSSSSNGPISSGSSNNSSSSNGPTSSGSSNSNNSSSSGPVAGNTTQSPGSSAPGSTNTTTTTQTSNSYIDMILKAGQQSGVNPYVLAAMIMQEQGAGTSPLISGNYSSYRGYYNYFNVEAYQSGSMSAIQRGLWYASQSGSYGRPWNTPEKSIVGGAQNYADNYVKAGQNTFYLKKFNVQGSNLYKHQYMSNIQGAASEGANLAQAYTSEMKQSALEFIIPVYKNMPDVPCAAPTGDGSPNNKLSSLSVEGLSLTPSFGKDTQSYNLIVNTSVSAITIKATAADSSATISGAGTVSLNSGETDVVVTVKAKNGSVRTYTIHVAKQNGGATPSGTSSGSGSTPGSSTGPGSSYGPGSESNNSSSSPSTPGGSNVTVVTVGPQ